jgi:SnoaL-like domain
MSTESELQQLRATVQHLKDRQDILDCIMRECRGRDRQDVELTASCYWPEGSDEHGPILTPAPDYPERANKGHAMFFTATSHNITNHHCEIVGDTAHCESYVVGTLLCIGEQVCRLAPGRYIDQMERRNGEWRILFRRTVVDMALEGDASWLHSKAVNGFPRGVWSKEDPSYRSPTTPVSDDHRWREKHVSK